jgi:hypothetical protein
LRSRPALAKAARRTSRDAVLELKVMEAIGVILLFVAAFAVLNRIEFGRFD